ncbi:MAG: redoxin domain-containing protein [Vulcanimicrobiota bacterium]
MAFCRYITCPLCKLFVARLTRNYRRLKEQGLEIIIVYESPAESIMKYYKDKEEPFRVIPDPDRELYNLYGVESSREGFIKGMTRFSDMIEIVKKGLASFKPEGDLATIPADFLINENFVVEEAYYGEDIGDNIPIDDIKTFAGIK